MKNNIDLEIGQKIRAIRETEGMTQLQLAQRLGYESMQFVSLFERGQSKVPPKVIGQLKTIFGAKFPLKTFEALLLKKHEEYLKEQIKLGLNA